MEYNNKFEPVPITHDFMKRNFEELKTEFYILCDDKGNFMASEYSHNVWLLRFDNIDPLKSSEQVVVRYVHELRLFLEHIGYNIEFKI